MWLNFSNYGGGPNNPLFLYWPVILVGITAVLLFFPFQHIPVYIPRFKNGSIRFYKYTKGILYPHSRSWFAYSNVSFIIQKYGD
jgi:hypothetical protein